MSETYEPMTKLRIIEDEPDNRLLELAQIPKADFIITGNTNDFTMENYKGTKIVTPKEYWEEHNSVISTIGNTVYEPLLGLC